MSYPLQFDDNTTAGCRLAGSISRSAIKSPLQVIWWWKRRAQGYTTQPRSAMPSTPILRWENSQESSELKRSNTLLGAIG
jgi:hypothetical protein